MDLAHLCTLQNHGILFRWVHHFKGHEFISSFLYESNGMETGTRMKPKAPQYAPRNQCISSI